MNLRIEPLRNKIAEKARIRAELEAQRQIRKAEEERTRKEKEAEEARTRAKLEAERLAKEAEQERIEKEQKEKEQRQLQELKEANPGIYINDYEEFKTFLEVFERVKNVIVERLDGNEEEISKEDIKLDYVLTKDLGVEDINDSYFGYVERMELAFGIEEEFDVVIDDEYKEKFLYCSVREIVNFILQMI